MGFFSLQTLGFKDLIYYLQITVPGLRCIGILLLCTGFIPLSWRRYLHFVGFTVINYFTKAIIHRLGFCSFYGSRNLLFTDVTLLQVTNTSLRTFYYSQILRFTNSRVDIQWGSQIHWPNDTTLPGSRLSLTLDCLSDSQTFPTSQTTQGDSWISPAQRGYSGEYFSPLDLFLYLFILLRWGLWRM